ncbi:hypothetical protein ACFOLL_12815 [Falsochrobactrum ovis]|uniref:Uncharacterized protein n=1 Tax=Falsochrobactrum ovis TaxID=1293442 RepID=A0A364JSV7_9HYPH|nr:hypothetical protein [Falsochrobactrum ovis]RAK26330.1 hypothetical protein C7374_11415 [Falsochrobactrum ovis]
MNIHTNITTATKGKRKTGGKSMAPRDLIAFTFDRAGKRKDEAVRAVIDAAEHNAALAEFLISEGARSAVGQLIRSDNAKIFNDDPNADISKPRALINPPPLISPAQKRRLERAANSVLRLLEAVLPNGTLMADAKRPDIEHAIGVYEPQARDMWQKANFYKTVLRELPAGKCVADTFDNEKLTALYNAARAA